MSALSAMQLLRIIMPDSPDLKRPPINSMEPPGQPRCAISCDTGLGWPGGSFRGG